jgi:glycosyltransferase involved in cell wall biosynthesis
VSSRIKVLQVGKYYAPVPGGIETHLALLARGLREVVDLEVVVANGGRREVHDKVDGVDVRRLGTATLIAGAPICPSLGRVMREAEADIVHIHAPHPTALVTFLMSRCRSRLICTYHSDIVRQRVLGKLIAPLQHLALSRADAIIVSSSNLLDSSHMLRRHRNRCHVIPFGIDPSAYQTLDQGAIAQLRTRFAPPIILSVGRLVYYKGFEFLIRAFARAKIPGSLLIIGEGNLRARLEGLIEELDLNQRVLLLGHVDSMVPYYQTCDLFVLPSVARSEAFGIVQLEAMACGKAVINTQLESGVPFVSQHGKTGRTVPPGDADSLAAAINQLMADDSLRQRFGEAGRRRVETEFTAERMVEQTVALYREIMSR